jgi:Domain of unknown function (DUF4168)
MLKYLLTGFCVLAIWLTLHLPAQAQPAPTIQPAQPAPTVQPAQPAPTVQPAQPSKPAPPAAKPPATGKSAPAAAVGKGDLDKFAAAIKQMLTINQTSEAQIGQVIKTEGLTDQRFKEIYAAERDPKIKLTPPMTELEKKSYGRAVAQIVKIQQNDESQMEKVIVAQGMDLKRFNEIFEVVQKDPSLQQEVKKRLQG